MLQTCKQHKAAFQTVLRGRNLKATPGRLAVLDIFIHNSKPLSIKELKIKVGLNGPDTATLYRNVESLSLKGLLTRINLGGKNASYELSARKHHHHLVCSSCGLVSDITISSRPGLNIQALKGAKDFINVTGHSLEFFGICKKCFKK